MVKKKKKKKKNFTSFGQPTRLITCANHGNDVMCARQCGLEMCHGGKSLIT